MAKLKLLQNVMIDGVVRNAGTVIDAVKENVNADSMLSWGWAIKHGKESAEASDESPASEPSAEGEGSENEPADSIADPQPVAKPKRSRK